MSRTTTVENQLPARALHGRVAVFDPAMCCASGICGPGADPALLQVARDLRWLEAQGVSVTRYNLAQEPQEFVAEQRIGGLLQAFGEEALPATLVDGRVLVHGRYPTREELVAALEGSAGGGTASRRGLPVNIAASSCKPGSGCC